MQLLSVLFTLFVWLSISTAPSTFGLWPLMINFAHLPFLASGQLWLLLIAWSPLPLFVDFDFGWHFLYLDWPPLSRNLEHHWYSSVLVTDVRRALTFSLYGCSTVSVAFQLWFKASHNLLSLWLWLALSTFSLWLVVWHLAWPLFDTSYPLLVINFGLLYLALTFLPRLSV